MRRGRTGLRPEGCGRLAAEAVVGRPAAAAAVRARLGRSRRAQLGLPGRALTVCTRQRLSAAAEHEQAPRDVPAYGGRPRYCRPREGSENHLSTGGLSLWWRSRDSGLWWDLRDSASAYVQVPSRIVTRWPVNWLSSEVFVTPDYCATDQVSRGNWLVARAEAVHK